MKNSKIGTVALVVGIQDDLPQLIDSISDDREIAILEAAYQQGEEDPLGTVYLMRERQRQEEEEFGDYVEELLSQPFVRPEIQEHGLQWLKSKIRIEQYQKCEAEATKVIATYAFRLFQEDPRRQDFCLAGPTAQVRVRVFQLPRGAATRAPREAA